MKKKKGVRYSSDPEDSKIQESKNSSGLPGRGKANVIVAVAVPPVVKDETIGIETSADARAIGSERFAVYEV